MDNDLQKEINGPLHSKAQLSNVWLKITVNYRHLVVCSHTVYRLHTNPKGTPLSQENHVLKEPLETADPKTANRHTNLTKMHKSFNTHKNPFATIMVPYLKQPPLNKRSGDRGIFTVFFTFYCLFVSFSPVSLSRKGKLKRFSHISFKTHWSIRTSMNFVTPFFLTTCSVCHFYSTIISIREWRKRRGWWVCKGR